MYHILLLGSLRKFPVLVPSEVGCVLIVYTLHDCKTEVMYFYKVCINPSKYYQVEYSIKLK
jgi:hypothetical protein